MEWRSSFCAGTGTDTLFNSFSLKNVSSVFSACVGKKDSNPSEYFYKDKVPYVRLNSQGSEEDIPFTNHSQPNINYKSSFISKMESLNSATSELMRKDRWGTLMAPQIIGGFVGTKSLSSREQPFSIGVISAPVNLSDVIEVAQTLVNTMHSGKFETKSNLNIDRSDNIEAHSDSNKESNASVMSDCGQKSSENFLFTGEEQVTNKHSTSFEGAKQKEDVSFKDECSEVPTYASVASKPCSQNHDNLPTRVQSSRTLDQSSSVMATLPKSRHFNRNCVDRKSRGHYRQKGFSKNNRYVATENKPTANKKHLCGNWISESKKETHTNIPATNFAHIPCENPYKKLNAKKHSEMKFMKQDKKAAIEDLCNSNSSTFNLVSEAQNIACDINLRNRHLTFNKLNDTCKTNVNRNMGENSKPRKRRRRRRKRRPKSYDERSNEESQLDGKLDLDDVMKNKTVTKQECSESIKGTSNPLEMDCLALKLSISPPICTNATIAFILGICSDVDSQDTESDSDSFQDDYEENERLWQLLQKSGSKISLPTDEIDCSKVIKPEETNSKEIDTVESSGKPSLIKCSDFKELDVIEVFEDEDIVTVPSVTSQLHEVNCNWNKDIEKPVSPRRCKDPSKKVHFAEGKTLCQVKHIVAWAYAYQAARKGDWENYARDRARFALRIKDVEKCISKVLDPVHRKQIYDKFVCGEEGS